MSSNVVWHHGDVSAADRARVTGGSGVTVLLTGLSGSGKSTIAAKVERALLEAGRAAYVLDGDNVRHGLNSDLGFDEPDRVENVRRVGEVSRLMNDAGLVVLLPVIAPFASARLGLRSGHERAGMAYLEVFVDTPLEICEARDPKGLYARARTGEITGMTGIDSPYERPEESDLTLDTTRLSIEQAAQEVLSLIDSLNDAFDRVDT